jgi:hypothetical protein
MRAVLDLPPGAVTGVAPISSEDVKQLLLLAVAESLFEAVSEPGETPVFATRDREQGEVAATMGFEVI